MTAGESFALAAVAGWLAILTVVTVLLSRQLALLHDSIQNLTVSPNLHTMDVDSDILLEPSLRHLLRANEDRDLVLLFLSRTCTGCEATVEEIATLPTLILQDVIAICEGEAGQTAFNLSPLVAKGVAVLPAQQASTVFRALNVEYVPFALHVRNQLVVARTPPGSTPQGFAEFTARAISSGAA